MLIFRDSNHDDISISTLACSLKITDGIETAATWHRTSCLHT